MLFDMVSELVCSQWLQQPYSLQPRFASTEQTSGQNGSIYMSSIARQLSNESVEQFITEVHQLGDNCKFGAMKEEFIRDRLVVIICDHALSEHLEMEVELTLEKAKRLIRQHEAVKEQQEMLKN